MNFMDTILPQQREAKIRYLDAEYEIIKTGDFVRCGVTGDPIRIDSLRYWNVDKQIPYVSAHVAFVDFLKHLPVGSPDSF